MKKAFAMLLSLALLLGAAGAMAESTTITMGTNAGFAPFEYIGDDGEITGFDVELAYLMAQEMGMELVIEDMYFDGLLAALDQGTVDFVMAAMTINDERKEAALFSTPYFNASQAVVVLEDYEGIQTVEDIADKKVATQDGTTGYFMALDTFGCDASNVAAFKASTDCVLELTSGRADCIIIDDSVAQNFLQNFDGLKIVEGLEMPLEEYGIAVKLGNEELLEKINAALQTLVDNGTYDEIYAKYFLAAEETEGAEETAETEEVAG